MQNVISQALNHTCRAELNSKHSLVPCHCPNAEGSSKEPLGPFFKGDLSPVLPQECKSFLSFSPHPTSIAGDLQGFAEYAPCMIQPIYLCHCSCLGPAMDLQEFTGAAG